jgi:hypothetical protein
MVSRDKNAKGQEQGHIDLEPTETYIRDSMHQIGSIMLEELLNSDNGGFQGKTLPCQKSPRGPRGHKYKFKEFRDKNLLTVLGPVTVKRAYYYDKHCKKGYCPKDVALDIMETSFSPGMRRIMGWVGALRPFGLGHEDIKEMAGIEVNSKEIERISYQLGTEVEEYFNFKYNYKNGADLPLLAASASSASSTNNNNIIKWKSIQKMYICMDGTGVPAVKKEIKDRRGKHEDGLAKTREAKLGCVFTQTTVDEKGLPVRDEGSTTYVGYIETAEDFGDRIYAEALSRGLESAQKVCVIGDGAAWIWNIADFHFKGAIQIIDLYHAREHYWHVAKEIFSDKNTIKAWTEQRRKELDLGEVEKVIAAIKQISPTTEEEKEIMEKEINYFKKNKERMRYKDFKNQGLFIGSGVVEAGCRSVIGLRLKQSGMHWTVPAANNIIALRCCILSNKWEDFWEYRAS